MQPKPLSVVLAKPKGAVGRRHDGGSGASTEDGEGRKLPAGSFLAELAEWDGKKFESANEETATGIARLLDQANYTVAKLEQKDRSREAASAVHHQHACSSKRSCVCVSAATAP